MPTFIRVDSFERAAHRASAQIHFLWRTNSQVRMIELVRNRDAVGRILRGRPYQGSTLELSARAVVAPLS